MENILLIMTIKKTYFSIQINKNTKKVFIDGLKTVSFMAAFMDITRRGDLHEESSIHTVEMTAIKIALKEIYKRWLIYTLSKLYAGYRILQRKSEKISPT